MFTPVFTIIIMQSSENFFSRLMRLIARLLVQTLSLTPLMVKKIASGVYSKSIGIISLGTSGAIEIVREAKRSGLTIKELRDLVLKELTKEYRIKPLI